MCVCVCTCVCVCVCVCVYDYVIKHTCMLRKNRKMCIRARVCNVGHMIFKVGHLVKLVACDFFIFEGKEISKYSAIDSLQLSAYNIFNCDHISIPKCLQYL